MGIRLSGQRHDVDKWHFALILDDLYWSKTLLAWRPDVVRWRIHDLDDYRAKDYLQTWLGVAIEALLSEK